MRFRCPLLIVYACIVFFVAVGILCHSLLFSSTECPASEDIISLAIQYLDVPYRYGGDTPEGFDCSGYMQYLFGRFGYQLPRTADKQATIGIPVAFANLLPGHLVCFATDETPDITHNGMYIGNWQFIHASSSAKKVIISSLTENYWKNAFRTARQILPDKQLRLQRLLLQKE